MIIKPEELAHNMKKFLREYTKLIQYAARAGIVVDVSRFYATPEQQYVLFKDKKSLCDGYDKLSKHQLGLAIDIFIYIDGEADFSDAHEYRILGKYWEAIGHTWGGNFKSFKDVFHFEY